MTHAFNISAWSRIYFEPILMLNLNGVAHAFTQFILSLTVFPCSLSLSLSSLLLSHLSPLSLSLHVCHCVPDRLSRSAAILGTFTPLQ